MASSTIRKAIGVVKDQTSISIAKVAGNLAPDLEVLVVKATSHEEVPADEKYIREILSLTSHSRAYISASFVAISKRLNRTRDWIVAVKALMLLHRLLIDGHPAFEEEIVFATRRGTRILNMSDFRDEAHSSSWDHAGFVRVYALYLDEKVEFVSYRRKLRGSVESEEGEFREDQNNNKVTPVREMGAERVLERLKHLLRMLDRVLGCRPSGAAKSNRLVLVALYQIVRDSFKLYVEVCDVLGVLLDRFTEMEYVHCVGAFDFYVSASKMMDELVGFYGWCKDVGIARSSEYPEVQRITDKLLGTLESFLKDMNDRAKSTPERKLEVKVAVQEAEPGMNEVKALPAPESVSFTAPPGAAVWVAQAKVVSSQEETRDLVDLREDGVSVDEQGNKLALALFNGAATVRTEGAWEAFPSNGECEVKSAWETPAAEVGKADWELALVETGSNLSKQKAELAGGFDPLLLNGMYDQGAVRQHVSTSQLSGGSASSVALPGPGNSGTRVLSLPAPDGTVQAVGPQDPFAASLSVPPPSYVQIADMEKKQHLLVQEQQVWQQYGRDGMQGQVGLARVAAPGNYAPAPQPMMPYGMPQFGGVGQPGAYYQAPYY